MVRFLEFRFGLVPNRKTEPNQMVRFGTEPFRGVVAMTSLMKKKYIMKDVKRWRKSKEYAEMILRAAKFARLTSKISQIFLIYNEIEMKFQRNIFMFKTDTKLDSFFTNLNDHKNVWWQLIERKRSDENEFSSQFQNIYDYLRYVNYQSTYQRFRNDRSKSKSFRFSQYIESQRYDQIYDDNRAYQSRDFFSNYSNYLNESDKTNFNSNSFYSKSSSSQNDINRTQKSSFNADQNVNDYTSRSDWFRNTSLKNDSSADQIRSNWTSWSTQFSSKSNEFDRKNDEYTSKIYNTKTEKSNLNQKYSSKNEYDEKYSQKDHNHKNMSINFAEYDEQDNELYYEKVTIDSENKFKTFVEFVEIEISCITCKKVFSFRNKLHKHLKNCKSAIKTEKIKKSMTISQPNINEKHITVKSMIVKSTAFIANKNYELVFRKWNYAEAFVKLRFEFTKNDYVYLNIDIEASLTNKSFVFKRLSKSHIHLMISFLTVRNIESNIHEIKKYVNFSIYLFSKNDSNKMTKIHREMHLIKNLKANMFIDNDILELKEFIINVQEKKTTIRSCQNLIIDVKIHQRESLVRRNVVNQFAIVISSKSYVKILYKMKNLFSNRDFLFESSSEVSMFIYAHVIDVRITEIIVDNESAKSMKISKNFKLDVTQEI
jgi:hypothetical protein